MEIVSGAGDGVFWVGLIAVLLEAGVGAGGFAVAVVVRLAPRALLSAAATSWAERHPTRVVLVMLDIARSIAMIAAAVLSALGATPWAVLVPVAIAYSLAAPYRPLVTGALPAVAAERDLSALNARVSTVRQLMTFLGPLAGAVVVGAGSPTVCFVVNALSFAAAAALMRGVRELDDGPVAHRRAEVGAAGWGLAAAEPGVRVIVVLVGAMYVVRGAELVLFALLSERLDLGDGGIGVLTGAVGLGALAVMPVAARLADRLAPDRALTVSTLMTVAPMLVMAVGSSVVTVCLALVLLGASVVAFEVVSVLTLQRIAPRGAVARVFGLVAASSNAGKLVGALAAPLLVVVTSLEVAFVIVAGVVVVAGAGCAPGVRALSDRAAARRRVLRPTVEVLAGLALFDGASRASLERLATTLTEQDVGVGRALIREGEPADALYIVRRGRFEAFVGDRRVNTIDTDGWFGEIGLLQRVPRTATVVAATDGVVWRIPGPDFLDALTDVASMPAALLAEMSERLRRTAEAHGAASPSAG